MTLEQIKATQISTYDYDLPSEFIAQKPLAQRTSSKLLVYKSGEIRHKSFDAIVDELPAQSLVLFNNTRVIPARIYATKETGARIQIFLLSPQLPYEDSERALATSEGPVTWECIIGNAKRWKEGEQLSISVDTLVISFTLKDRANRRVEITWNQGLKFGDVLERIGKMPLPPYIKREAQEDDSSRYQTVYAKHDGAVAAPTAGLHFSPEILHAMQDRSFALGEVTLHVGAGTFKPVEDDLVWNHPMHEEYYEVTKELVQLLLKHKHRIATGTTTLRTLETLYWVGVQISRGAESPLDVTQHYAYEHPANLTYEEAMNHVLDFMQQQHLNKVSGLSGIMIMPGYHIKSIQGLITNFHLPKSTLLLLISALVGDDWKRIYSEAKAHSYRFLSYGDSSLLIP